ncbi:hypothetical protein MTO96_013495 [Rhipicephalus appendiculatus]
MAFECAPFSPDARALTLRKEENLLSGRFRDSNDVEVRRDSSVNPIPPPSLLLVCPYVHIHERQEPYRGIFHSRGTLRHAPNSTDINNNSCSGTTNLTHQPRQARGASAHCCARPHVGKLARAEDCRGPWSTSGGGSMVSRSFES